MNGTKPLVYVSAAGEGILGVIALISPSTVVWLLWAIPLTIGGQLLGRMLGVALVSLAVACWPQKSVDASQVRGLLTYNALIAVFFLIVALRTPFIGIVLWPAIVFHTIMTVLFVLAWRSIPAVAR